MLYEVHLHGLKMNAHFSAIRCGNIDFFFSKAFQGATRNSTSFGGQSQNKTVIEKKRGCL